MTTGPGGRRRRRPDPARVRALQQLAQDHGLDATGLAAAAGVAVDTARAWLLGLQLPGPAAMVRLQRIHGPDVAPHGPRLAEKTRAGLWPGRVVRLKQRPRDQPDAQLRIVAVADDGTLEGVALPSGRLVRWGLWTWRTLIPARERQPPAGWRPSVRVIDRDLKPDNATPAEIRANVAGRPSDPALPPHPFRKRGELLDRSLRPGLEVAVFHPRLRFEVPATRRVVVKELTERRRKVVRALVLDPAQDWIFRRSNGARGPERVYPSRAMRFRGLAVAVERVDGSWAPDIIPLHQVITTWDAWINREVQGARRPRHDHVDDHAAEFGLRLRELRALAGLSLERTASLAQMSPAILSHLENGHADTFRGVSWNLWPLASALRCDPRDLFAPINTPLLKDTPMPTSRARTPKPAYEGTTVEVSKSKAEAEELVRRRGCKQYQWTTLDHPITGRPRHEFRFELRTSTGASVRVRLAADVPEIKQRYHGSSRVRRKPRDEVEAEERRLMRVLVANLKAMFTSAEAGLVRTEDVFLPYIEDMSGTTIAEHLSPVLPQLLARPFTPALLALGAGELALKGST